MEVKNGDYFIKKEGETYIVFSITFPKSLINYFDVKKTIFTIDNNNIKKVHVRSCERKCKNSLSFIIKDCKRIEGTVIINFLLRKLLRFLKKDINTYLYFKKSHTPSLNLHNNLYDDIINNLKYNPYDVLNNICLSNSIVKQIEIVLEWRNILKQEFLYF